MTGDKNNAITSIMNSLVTKIILQNSFVVNVVFLSAEKLTLEFR